MGAGLFSLFFSKSPAMGFGLPPGLLLSTGAPRQLVMGYHGFGMLSDMFSCSLNAIKTALWAWMGQPCSRWPVTF